MVLAAILGLKKDISWLHCLVGAGGFESFMSQFVMYECRAWRNETFLSKVRAAVQNGSVADSGAVESVGLALMPQTCHYLKAFGEGKMRLYAAQLQRGHTSRGSYSLCTLSYPPTHSHHFIALYLHDCRVLCHVLAITTLVLSYTETLTPFRVTLLRAGTETTHTHVQAVFFFFLCVWKNTFCFLSRSYFRHMHAVKDRGMMTNLPEITRQILFVIIQL